MELRLYQPQYQELLFRQQLLSDPETMAFNRGGEPAEDYDPKTGCIDFPPSYWPMWYRFWLENEPQNFYAVLADGRTPVGEISWYFDGSEYRVGIILLAKYRGRGYCAPALSLLAARAFDGFSLPSLSVTLSTASTAAVKGFLRAGFRRVRRGGGTCDLRLTKEDFEEQRNAKKKATPTA